MPNVPDLVGAIVLSTSDVTMANEPLRTQAMHINARKGQHVYSCGVRMWEDSADGVCIGIVWLGCVANVTFSAVGGH